MKSDNKEPIVLKQAISKEACALISEYLRFKSSLKPNLKKDRLANVHREYADPMMDMFLEKLRPSIEEATQLKLWPTLSFYYLYKEGTLLEKHRDRSSCEIVAGLCIDADPEFKKQGKTWPLQMTIKGKPKAIDLDYGDLVIFRGSETEHWREAFTGSWFISAIFAYVDKEGPQAFQKFDQRAALGTGHVGMLRWSFKVLIHTLQQKISGYWK